MRYLVSNKESPYSGTKGLERFVYTNLLHVDIKFLFLSHL